jgi:hypothetical protein
MVLISKAQPNLVGGVSQQPDALRLESQCKVQENAYGTIVEGLKKRFPTQWLNPLSTVANDNLSGASYHWVNRDQQERYLLAVVNNTFTGNAVRAWDLNGLPVVVHYPATLPVIQNYLAHSAMTDFKWTTVNDFTFLTNKVQIPTLGTPSAAQNKRKAYIYIRQGNYKINYKATVTFASATVDAEVSTWDGTTAGTTASAELWRANVSVVVAGSITILGYTRNWATGATALTNAVAAINAASAGDSLDEVVTAYASGGQLFIRSKIPGLSFSITASTGLSSITEIVDAQTAEYANIKTDDIAAQLATKLNTAASLTSVAAGWSTSVSGSVIEVTHSTTDIVAITTKDSIGDTAMKSYFQTVDNFDELPPRCRDGVVFKIQGSVETAEDDFYVKFVAKVPGDFGEGEWRETVGPAVNTTLSNMPLAIVRRFDDASGTITGTPFQPYFSVEYYSWFNRLVGDDSSNPAPTFVDTSIIDVFFHKNRLGLLTESSVVMSEAGIYGNFWRTTVRQLLDADPIDIQASHTSVAKLEHAVPHNERLIVFADRAQFVVTGEPLLTPKTASIQFVTAYEADMGVSPVAVGKNIYFATNRDSYASMWEFQQILENVTVGSYQANNLATQIPRYIPSNVSEIVGSSTEEVFFLRCASDPDTLYVWKYFINGNDIIQSAWSKFTYPFEILTVAFYDNTLYMVTKIGTGYALQKMDIKFGTDTFSTVTAPLIDARINMDSLTKTLVGGNTRVTVPTDFDLPATGWTSTVVKADGTVLAVTRISSSQFEIPGNQTAVTGMHFGHPYTMRYQFGRVDVREDTRNGGSASVKTGRYQNLFGVLKFANTNNFTVSVQIQQETPATMTYTASLGNDGGGSVKLDNGEYRFPTLTKTDNLTIEVTNATPFPCTILGAEWIANFTTNFQRYRA